MAYTYQRERSTPLVTFLVGTRDPQESIRKPQTKASSFIRRMKAIQNSRLMKQGRLYDSGKFQTNGGVSRFAEESITAADHNNLRRSLQKLSLASLLTQPHSNPKKSSADHCDRPRGNLRPMQNSICRLQNRIAKQSPLYGMLVEELSKSFMKKQNERPQRYRRVEMPKQPLTSDDHIEKYIAVIEREPEILAVQLEVAGHNPQHIVTDSKLNVSSYYSTSVNLEQHLVEPVKALRAETAALEKCVKRVQSYSSSRPSTVTNRRSTDNNSPIKHVVDVVELFGRSQTLQGDQLLLFKLMAYRDFLWKVAFSNQMVLNAFERPKYYVGRGNNSKLLRMLMARRWWWIREHKQDQANLVWTQLKVFEVYQKQLSSPKLGYPPQECVEYQLKQRDYKDPSSKILNEQQLKQWRSYLCRNHHRQKKSNELLESRNILLENCRQLDQQDCMLITNHLQFSRYIGNKKALLFTMKQYYDLLGEDHSLYFPRTFHLTSGIEDDEYLNFLSLYHDRKKKGLPNYWIIKPGEMSNRGNGITVCDSLESIKLILKYKERHENGRPKTYILQHYLQSPFLYKGRKFDIRHYILITRTNGILKGYWYEEGYIRTTSYEYSLGQMNSQIHLTNDAVQKHCRDYGKFEKGNKLSYREFQQYLDLKYGPKTYDFHSLVQTKIRKVATDIIKAASLTIDPKRRLNNFQIFGMDFMVDSEFNPWLIEVNTNPCLQLAAPLLAKLIPQMVDNALRIAVDPLYPPPTGSCKKVYPEINRFHLVYDELVDGPELEQAYRKAKMIWEVLQNVGEDDEAYEDCDSDDEVA